MKLIKLCIIAASLLIAGMSDIQACTSVIISGRVTASGRPLMLKVRDQKPSKRNNSAVFFKGEEYDYIGLVADISKMPSNGVVGGYNTAGFCIMSLTAHGFPLDTAKHRKGVLRYALEHCRNIDEFDEYVDKFLVKNVVISNIGVIDAEGGAAYYEFGGHTYTKYDVNDPAVAPDGWRCCTNFCWSGDIGKGGGMDRWENAFWAMECLEKNADGKYEIKHGDIIDAVCRSYRQKRLGVESVDDLSRFGHFFDSGFIGYRNTCATMVFEGVAKGEDPKYTVMWLQLGHPACCPSFPCILGHSNQLPGYFWTKGDKSGRLYSDAMSIRDKYIYDEQYSSSNYFNVKNVRDLIALSRKTEAYIDGEFYPVWQKWFDGELSDSKFYASYREMMSRFYLRFREDFNEYL